MKLAVSNIAWGKEDLPGHLRLLSELGCAGVEIAPSINWEEPTTSTVAERRELRSLIEDHGLVVIGLHALFYTRPDLFILGDAKTRRSAIDYLKELIELCATLGGETLVFGSPSARKRGELTHAEAIKRAAEFFYECAVKAGEHDVYVLIEPLTTGETDFINSCTEGMELVWRVDHPHFRLHLDGRVMISNQENYDEICREYVGQYLHVHVSDTGLAPPGSTGMDHRPLGQALRKAHYDRYVSLEMRQGFGPSYEVISQAVEHVKRCYLEQ